MHIITPKLPAVIPQERTRPTLWSATPHLDNQTASLLVIAPAGSHSLELTLLPHRDWIYTVIISGASDWLTSIRSKGLLKLNVILVFYGVTHRVTSNTSDKHVNFLMQVVPELLQGLGGLIYPHQLLEALLKLEKSNTARYYVSEWHMMKSYFTITVNFAPSSIATMTVTKSLKLFRQYTTD